MKYPTLTLNYSNKYCIFLWFGDNDIDAYGKLKFYKTSLTLSHRLDSNDEMYIIIHNFTYK